MTEHRLFPYLLILGAGSIWGATFSLALITTAKGAHPLGLSAWQVVITGAFFFVVCGLSRVNLFAMKNLRHYLVLAVVGITVPNMLYYYAAPHCRPASWRSRFRPCRCLPTPSCCCCASNR